MSKKKWGGAREGAGRKPSGRKKKSFALNNVEYSETKRFVEWLRRGGIGDPYDEQIGPGTKPEDIPTTREACVMGDEGFMEENGLPVYLLWSSKGPGKYLQDATLEDIEKAAGNIILASMNLKPGEELDPYEKIIFSESYLMMLSYLWEKLGGKKKRKKKKFITEISADDIIPF